MSHRFLIWAEAWIDENILPGANTDVESYEDKAKRLLGELHAEAAKARFKKAEMDEERKNIVPQILTAVSDTTDFDFDVYTLKFLLAEELEDGD